MKNILFFLFFTVCASSFAQPLFNQPRWGIIPSEQEYYAPIYHELYVADEGAVFKVRLIAMNKLKTVIDTTVVITYYNPFKFIFREGDVCWQQISTNTSKLKRQPKMFTQPVRDSGKTCAYFRPHDRWYMGFFAAPNP